MEEGCSGQAFQVHNNRRPDSKYLFFRKKFEHHCFNLRAFYFAYCCIGIVWPLFVCFTFENKGNRNKEGIRELRMVDSNFISEKQSSTGNRCNLPFGSCYTLFYDEVAE